MSVVAISVDGAVVRRRFLAAVVPLVFLVAVAAPLLYYSFFF